MGTDCSVPLVCFAATRQKRRTSCRRHCSWGVICRDGDYSKLTDQLRKMDGYEYNGSVGSHTHNAMNVVPYRVFPPALGERIGHRTGLRMQVLCDKISRLDRR
jgi:hypothetical protein